ncbi:MAG TPA: DUF4159 domain-containing protein [Caldithrix abyssi]|uniref:DUF4159 domain-containing protein n=1 Tax=Caldithrix abyssi TaxID=187145 RepID=A0A7V5RPZ5_CALAY|nr:DUF4159 domain-containing protein [Caldithrix abyssi]
MYKAILIASFLIFTDVPAQVIAPVRIHYQGGGDWYGNKTTWKNILAEARKRLGMPTAPRETSAKIEDPEFSQSPIAYLAGHGNVVFDDQEAAILRRYLTRGGFLFADDDYGMDRSFRRAMKKVFPELDFTPLPFSHPIYHAVYDFNNGLPKVHEHAGGPPQGLGLIYEGRLVCFYSFNTDISDGCEDAQIHKDPESVRGQALKMALNILVYALTN